MLKTRPALLCAALLVAAVPTLARAQRVAQLDLTPRSVTLAVGERREVLASAYDARGDIVTIAFRWATSDPAVVRVEPDLAVPGVGYLIGVNGGTAVVEVHAGGRSATASVRVVSGPGGVPIGTGTPTVLHVEPTTVYLLPTEAIQLRPVFLKDDGSPAAPVPLVWSSFRDEVARIGVGGRAIGIAPGQGVIEARTPDGRLSRRVPVHVENTGWVFAQAAFAIAPGASDTIGIIVPRQENRSLDPRALSWGIANPGIATITATGVLAGVAPGRTQLVASGFGQELRAPVAVHRRVESLTLAPPGDSVLVPLGGTATFRATARAADDTPVPEAPLRWELADTAIATFDSASGTVTGRAVGVTTLSVQGPGPGLQKSWRLGVAAAGLALDLHRFALSVGEQRTLTASFTDERGAPTAPASAVRWSSSDRAVVRVADGVVEAVGFGGALVTASSPFGGSDTARAFVTGELLVSSDRAGSFDVYTFDRQEPSRLHRVIAGPGREVDAVYAPDGMAIAYVADSEGNAELYVADADGSNPRRLTETSDDEGSPAWTPDGRQIVYHVADGRPQLWIVSVDGGEPRQLTREGVNLQPAVSPDGRTIAFATRRDRDYEIYLMDLDGSNQRNFTSAPGEETLPAWLGDSTIAFLREERARREVTRRVMSMTSSRGIGTLTPPELLVSDFAVAPDGGFIAATVTQAGPAGTAVQLFLIPLGGQPVEVPRRLDTERWLAPAFRP